MPRFTLFILGTFQAFIGDDHLRFRSWRERALLAYLATESDSPHERGHLATLLWSNRLQRDGLTNLRLTLSRLRHTLREAGADDLLLIQGNDIYWNPAAPALVDVQQFRRAVEPPLQTEQGKGGAPLSRIESIYGLRAAVDLYRGNFLAGFDGNNEEPFEEWMRAWRERLHQQALTSLFLLAEDALRNGNYTDVEKYAYRQLALERWREEAHRQLIQALASSGQRTAALQQYERLEQILAQEMGVEPDDASRALYRQIRRSRADSGNRSTAAQAPLRTMPPEQELLLPPAHPAAPTNLPTPLTPFFGREHEIAFVLERIGERGERLVTLQGEGGIGKSRLAIAVGQALLAGFPQGVWWVSLAELDPDTPRPDEALAECIAREFRLPLQGSENLFESLAAYFGNKRLLLILDDFDTLYDAAPRVLALLQQCPFLHILITSREALHYQAEVLLRLEGLPRPPAADPEPTAYSSVRLLIERAERTGWTVNPKRLESLAQLARFLRGVPLALELAAPWVGEIPLPELLESLQKGYDLLATTLRDMPSRHRSMQAIFETSWQRLTSRQRLLLAQLSIFRGHFSGSAVEAVAGAATQDLPALVAKSLVRQESEGWYSLHEHLRRFAQQQWQRLVNREREQKGDDQPLLATTAARHAAYYLGWLRGVHNSLYGERLPETLREFQKARANLYQAWQWAIYHEEWELLAAAAAPFRRALLIQGDLRDGVRHFEALVTGLPSGRKWYAEAGAAYIQFLSRAGQSATATEWLHRLLARGGLPPGARADLLALQAELLAPTERGEEADPLFQEALALARGACDQRLETTILVAACGGAWLRNEYERAQTYADAALPMVRAVGDSWAEVVVLNRLGVLTINLEMELDKAADYFKRGLSLARTLNDRVTEGTVLANLGLVAEFRHDYEVAYRHTLAALELHVERGNSNAVALTNANVGRLLCLVGQYREGQPYLEEALRLYLASGNQRGEGVARIYLGALESAQGNPRAALPHLLASAAIFRALSLQAFLPFPLNYAGEAYLQMSAHESAESCLLEAAALRRQVDDILLLKDTLALLVRLYLAWGKLEKLPPIVAELEQNLRETATTGAEHLVADYAALYEGQRALGDPAASATLEEARALLHRIAGRIQDPVMRGAYLAMPGHATLRNAPD